jgi:hypothetical protein
MREVTSHHDFWDRGSDFWKMHYYFAGAVANLP